MVLTNKDVVGELIKNPLMTIERNQHGKKLSQISRQCVYEPASETPMQLIILDSESNLLGLDLKKSCW